MNKIVECVPNFSEGRNPEIIERIAQEIRQTPEVILLDVDPGKDTHRTVITFAGSPEGVEEAAFRAIRMAAELIDMAKHKGEHPRMGATDVCPFVPVSGVTMEECAAIARRLGKRVADELSIPVFLYEEAAATPERKSLAYIREGEYEGLAEKLKRPEFRPNFGESRFNAKSGATVIGAREFLIAYNLNLNTRNVKLAKEIAKQMRETGYTKTNPATREKETVPGTLKAVRAVGWYIDEYQRAQISVNLLNYKITPLWRVFEEAERLAGELGVRVTGSELIGLIPLQAVRDVGVHYLEKQKGFTAASEEDLVTAAVQSLGLSEISPFKPDHKIIEYRFRSTGKLAGLTVQDFCRSVASDSPAPGGGSVAALCGSLSAALSAMVAQLTFGKKEYAEVQPEMLAVGEEAQRLIRFFIQAIDQDTDAFNQVMAAFALPKKTEAEKAAREHAVLEAGKAATRVPFSVLEHSLPAVRIAKTAVEKGNRNSVSDAGVAGLTAAAAAEGAYYNVLINIQSMTDEEFRREMGDKAKKLHQEISEISRQIQALMLEKLSS